MWRRRRGGALQTDFVEQANAICQAATDELTPVWDEMWSSFEGLDMDDPANQDLVFVRFGETLEVTSPAWREMAGDESAGAAMDDTDPMTDVNRRARSYGLDVCGEDG